MISSVEASFTLLQKPVTIIGFASVNLAHITLGLVLEILNPIDVIIFIGKQLRVVDRHLLELGNTQSIIRPKLVGIYDTIGAYMLFDNWKFAGNEVNEIFI